MTTHLTVDPMHPNPLTASLMMQNQGGVPTTTMSSFALMSTLQNMMQMNVLASLSTGNMVIDTIIQMIVLSLVASFTAQIQSFVVSVSDAIIGIIRFTFKTTFWSVRTLYYLVKPAERRTILKQVDIPYISDTRQINELYKALSWYLTHTEDIDYIREPFLQFVFDKKITVENRASVKNDLSINKLLQQKQTKKFSWKKHEINYQMDTELITVYTDKDRKRENFKVKLWTYIDEHATTDILEEFCQHAMREYIDNLASSTWVQQIYVNKGTEWTASPSNNTRKLETIILRESLKDNIREDMSLFLNSEEWYQNRDIPYTRGYLFYGHPGTGKTSMIKGLSLFCKRHIHFLMLSNVTSDAELIELLKKIPYKDTILVIEDIDAMINIVRSRDAVVNSEKAASSDSEEAPKKHRKHKKTDDTAKVAAAVAAAAIAASTIATKHDNPPYKAGDLGGIKPSQTNTNTLTLSGLLNALDGVFSCHGRIMIMTTNHPEVLDSALLRPGRLDSKFLFDNCDRDQISGLYEMFFNVPANASQLALIRAESYSPAHITSVFLRYRNKADQALLHLDDNETKVTIQPLVAATPAAMPAPAALPEAAAMPAFIMLNAK